MKQYFLRCWKNNPFFSFLLVLSFFMMFLMYYYGFSFGVRTSELVYNQNEGRYPGGAVIVNMDFDHDASDEVYIDPDLINLSDLSSIFPGNIYHQSSLNIGKDYMSNLGETMILMKQEEPIIEKLTYGHYPSEEERKEPCAVIGKGLMNSSGYVPGNPAHIKIEGVDFKVTGVFNLYAEPEDDNRLLLFWEGIPKESRKLFFYGSNNYSSAFYIVAYNTHPWLPPLTDLSFEGITRWQREQTTEQSRIESEKYTELYNLIQSYYPEKMEITTGARGLYYYSAVEYVSAENIDVTFYALIFMISLLNTAIVSYYWVQKKKKEWMLLLISGFSRLRIILGAVKELFLYELQSIIPAVFAILLITAFSYDWSHLRFVITHCQSRILFLFLLSLFASSVVPAHLLRRMKPAEVLKREE